MNLRVLSAVCLLVSVSVVKTQDDEGPPPPPGEEYGDYDGGADEINGGDESEGGDNGGNEPPPPPGGGSSGGCSDNASWCKKMRPSQCYNAEDICCQTCQSYKTGNSGCEFGDKNMECPERTKAEGYCDDQNVKELCCASCP